jgi:alcohol dehydrogenase class IV
LEVVVYNKILADPPDYMVDEVVALARAEKIDGMVAVGGGSTLDTGKAAKVVLGNNGKSVVDYLIHGAARDASKEILPFVKIPTTAGTGAETTLGAVITYNDKINDKQTKVVLFPVGINAHNEASLIDPELHLGCPPRITAACAFDVMAHALTGYLSVTTNLITQSIGMEALRLMLRSFKEAYDNGSSVSARTDMALACTLAGYTLSTGLYVIDHSFAHAMGAFYHKIPHGNCCAIFLPSTIEYFAKLQPEDILRLGDEVFHVKGRDAIEVGRKIGKDIYDMYRSVDLLNIKEVEPDQQKAYQIIPNAYLDLGMMFSSKKPTEEESKDFIDLAYTYAEKSK